jgi:hypothetical protein
MVVMVEVDGRNVDVIVTGIALLFYFFLNN